MARKNPIFKIFQKKCKSLEDIKNYLNINFYEEKLKNWIFPGQKTARKKRTFSQKSRPFLDGQEKI